jgi:GAF domain-containing protein
VPDGTVHDGRSGFCQFYARRRLPVSPGDVDFLSRASGQSAIAIENSLAYHEISQLKDKLAQDRQTISSNSLSPLSTTVTRIPSVATAGAQ